jgi:hypothetical protein
MFIDSMFNQVLRILWYTVLFIFWVFKAFFMTLANMGNRRR